MPTLTDLPIDQETMSCPLDLSSPVMPCQSRNSFMIIPFTCTYACISMT